MSAEGAGGYQKVKIIYCVRYVAIVSPTSATNNSNYLTPGD